jgi:hypothetical protein
MDNEKVLWDLSLGAGAATAVAPGRFEKELLRVGRWVHPARQFVLDVTRERLARWVECFRKMLSKGIRVPVPYGHSYDPRDNAGFLSDMRVDGDRLIGVLDIPRAEDAERLGSVAADVSVSVNPDFTDGQGERFGEVIEHVAITNYPIVTGQSNFVALESPGANSKIIRLEMDATGGDDAADAETESRAGAAADTNAPAGEGDNRVLLDRIAHLEEERLDREVDSLLLSGKISPAVSASVRRLLSAGGEALQLSATGESVSPAEELRAILAALPAGAWVPLETRAAGAKSLARRDAEMSDERARLLAQENARIIAKGGAEVRI